MRATHTMGLLVVRVEIHLPTQDTRSVLVGRILQLSATGPARPQLLSLRLQALKAACPTAVLHSREPTAIRPHTASRAGLPATTREKPHSDEGPAQPRPAQNLKNATSLLLHGDDHYTGRVKAFCSAVLMTQMLAVERSSWCLMGSLTSQQSPAGLGGKGNWTTSLHHRWLLRLVGRGSPRIRISRRVSGSLGPGSARPSQQPFSTWTGQHARALSWRPGGSSGSAGRDPLPAQPPAPHGGEGSGGSPRHPLSPLLRPQGCMYHSALLSAARGAWKSLPSTSPRSGWLFGQRAEQLRAGTRGCPGDAGSPRAPCCGPWAGPGLLWAPRPQPGGRRHTGHPTSLRYVSPNSCGAPGQVVVGLTSPTGQTRGRHSVLDPAPSQAESETPLFNLAPQCSPGSCHADLEGRPPWGLCRRIVSAMPPAAAIQPLVVAGSRTPLAPKGWLHFPIFLKL